MRPKIGLPNQDTCMFFYYRKSKVLIYQIWRKSVSAVSTRQPLIKFACLMWTQQLFCFKQLMCLMNHLKKNEWMVRAIIEFLVLCTPIPLLSFSLIPEHYLNMYMVLYIKIGASIVYHDIFCWFFDLKSSLQVLLFFYHLLLQVIIFKFNIYLLKFFLFHTFKIINTFVSYSPFSFKAFSSNFALNFSINDEFLKKLINIIKRFVYRFLSYKYTLLLLSFHTLKYF